MYRLALAAALVIAAVVVPSALGAQAPASHDLTATAAATTPTATVTATPVEQPAPFALEGSEPQCRTSATQQIVPTLPAAICGGVNQGCCPGNVCAGNLVCIGGKCRGGA